MLSNSLVDLPQKQTLRVLNTPDQLCGAAHNTIAEEEEVLLLLLHVALENAAHILVYIMEQLHAKGRKTSLHPTAAVPVLFIRNTSTTFPVNYQPGAGFNSSSVCSSQKIQTAVVASLVSGLSR